MDRSGHAQAGRNGWAELRDATARGNYLPLLLRSIPGLAGQGTEMRANCPLPGHEGDKSRDFAINIQTGLWRCHKCNRSRNILTLLRALGWEDQQVRKELDQHGLLEEKRMGAKTKSKPQPKQRKTEEEKGPPPTEEHVAKFLDALLSSEKAKDLLANRGIALETATRFQLGWWDGRVTIPIRDVGGRLVNLKGHTLTGQQPKALNCSGYGAARLFGAHLLTGQAPRGILLLCEGELDAILANQHGFVAVSGTGGCNTFLPEWCRYFHGWHVVIVYDTDRPGREGAAMVLRELARDIRAGKVLSAKNLVLPFASPADGKDLTDWFKAGGTREKLIELIEAVPAHDAFAWPPLPEEANTNAAPPVCDLGQMLAATPAFREFVEAVAAFLQVPVEMPLMLGLAAVSLTLCGAVVIELKLDWCEPPPIWVIVLQAPGHRKSAALARIVRPILGWCKEEIEKLKPCISHQRQRREAMTRQLSRLTDSAAKPGGGKGAGALVEAQELRRQLDAEAIIYPPQLIAIDATPEAMCDLLVRNGERLGIFVAEGDPLDVLLGRYADGKPNLGIILCGFSGETYTVNRKARDPIDLAHPLVVIGLAIQPAAAQEMLESGVARGRGMVGRFLLIEPEGKLGTREFDAPPIPGDTQDWWNTIIHRLLEMPRSADYVLDKEPVTRRECDPAVVRLTPGAEAVFRELHEVIEPKLSAYGELKDVTEFGGKLMGHIGRIALALHFLGGHEATDPISGDTMRSAAAFSEFLSDHFLRIVEEAGRTEEECLNARVLAWLRRESRTEFNRSEFFKALRTSKHPRMEDWEPVIARLVAQGYVREAATEEGRPGRPPERYEANPAVFDSFAPNTRNTQMAEADLMFPYGAGDTVPEGHCEETTATPLT